MPNESEREGGAPGNYVGSCRLAAAAMALGTDSWSVVRNVGVEVWSGIAPWPGKVNLGKAELGGLQGEDLVGVDGLAVSVVMNTPLVFASVLIARLVPTWVVCPAL